MHVLTRITCIHYDFGWVFLSLSSCEEARVCVGAFQLNQLFLLLGFRPDETLSGSLLSKTLGLIKNCKLVMMWSVVYLNWIRKFNQIRENEENLSCRILIHLSESWSLIGHILSSHKKIWIQVHHSNYFFHIFSNLYIYVNPQGFWVNQSQNSKFLND